MLTMSWLYGDSLCSAGRTGTRIVGTMQGGDTEEEVSNHPTHLQGFSGSALE